MGSDWQQRYEANDTPWDKGEPSPGLMEFLEKFRLTGRVLVPGCGAGHDVRAIARQGGNEVVGMDIAPGAAQVAARHDNPPNCTFETADFLDLPAPHRQSHDWVWEHTLFCAINPKHRRAYAQAAADALRPGGRYLAIFYMNPEKDPDDVEPPHGVTPEELDSLFNPVFSLEADWIPQNNYESRPGRERMRLYRLL